MSKYPWAEIKAEIELGKRSLKEIAEKYKPDEVNTQSAYVYIRRKKQEKGWNRKEEVNKKFTEKVLKKVLEEEVDKEAKLRQEYQKIINYIRRDTANELSAKDPETEERITDYERLKELKISTEIIHNCRKEDWELLEIKEVAKQIEQEANVNIKKEEIPYERRIAAIKALGGASNGRPVAPPVDNGSQN